MSNVIVGLAEYLHKSGMLHTSLLLLAIILACLGLVYFGITLDTHLSHSPLSKFIRYGKYEVIAEHQHTKERHIIVVTSLNEVSAVEKATKKLKDLEYFRFKTRKKK